jgi:hypothetical protein
MKKPVPRQIHPDTLDYHDCVAWIEQKYKVDLRDYASHFKDRDKPYLDFWHWLLDNDFSEVHNGSFNLMSLNPGSAAADPPDWVKEILKMFKDEFDVDNEDELNFWIEW